MDNSKDKDSKNYYECLIKMLQIYLKYIDVIKENKHNKIRNKIFMFELFSLLREKNILEHKFLDFIYNELFRIYYFCNIVLNKGQNGVDEILKEGGWKSLNEYQSKNNINNIKIISKDNEVQNKIYTEYLNSDVNFLKRILDMEHKLEEKEIEYNIELKKIKKTYKNEITKIQSEKEEELEKQKNEIKTLNDKIILIQSETNKKEKEYKEQLQNIINNFVNAQVEENKEQLRIREEQIKNLQKNLEESNQKRIKELEEETKRFELKLIDQEKKSKEELKKQCDEIEKKFQEKKEEELKEKLKEEQKKIEEIKNKVKEINELYEKKIEEIKSEEMELIIKEYNEKNDNFNLEETRIYNNEKIEIFLNQILDNKIKSQIILNKLNIYIEELKKSLVEINHLNILLVGPSGVGKSTLINAILELKDEAKTGIGLPQTTEIKCFLSEKSDFLRLYDSRGIEKGKDFDIDKIYILLKEFILKQLETKDPNKYIHCIWYCWQGTRK